MRILVTGGAGFVGSHLVRRLLAQAEHTVVNLDALRYSGNPASLAEVNGHPRYLFVQADICDQPMVRSVLREHRIEGIINCAAETHVDRSILDPGSFARTDVVGTGVLLEEARQASVRRFLQVSTDEVYGSVETGMSTENDRLAPRSPYSASKAGGDLQALSSGRPINFPSWSHGGATPTVPTNIRRSSFPCSSRTRLTTNCCPCTEMAASVETGWRSKTIVPA